MQDETKVKFTYITLEEKLTNEYNGHCHQVTQYFVKDKPNQRRAIVLYRENELFGKYYHSFIVENGLVYGLTHNIVISYKDYIQIFDPKILVNELGTELINSMKNMNNMQKYIDCNWCDLTVYAISKS